MKLTIQLGAGGPVFRLVLPYDDCDHAIVDDMERCPGCKAKAPVKVQGTGKRYESDDTYAADGITVCCGKWLGTIRAKMNTLFGIREDEAVIAGPWRVY